MLALSICKLHSPMAGHDKGCLGGISHSQVEVARCSHQWASWELPVLEQRKRCYKASQEMGIKTLRFIHEVVVHSASCSWPDILRGNSKFFVLLTNLHWKKNQVSARLCV